MSNREERTLDNIVDAYFSALGITEPDPYDRFRERLLEDYPRLAPEFLAITGARHRHEEDGLESVYAVKNRDLGFSLRIASQFTGSQHRAYLKWFIRSAQEPPETIVDIGCDNGLLTCAYAGRFPDSNVIGVDPCVEAIERSTELAALLEIRNARFHRVSLDEFVATHNQGFANLVTLTTVRDELEPEGDKLTEVIDRLLDSREGRLVCFEVVKLPTFSSWLDLLREAGLVPESEPSAIEFEHGSAGSATARGCIMKRSTTFGESSL